MPCCEERGTRDVGQLGIVDGVRLVRRLVVVGLCVGVIPDDWHTLEVERALVAASNGVVPWTVAGVELERISVYVVLEPVAESGMSVSIEVYHVCGVLRLVVATHHVEVEIALHLADVSIVIDEELDRKSVV